MIKRIDEILESSQWDKFKKKDPDFDQKLKNQIAALHESQDFFKILNLNLQSKTCSIAVYPHHMTQNSYRAMVKYFLKEHLGQDATHLILEWVPSQRAKDASS